MRISRFFIVFSVFLLFCKTSYTQNIASVLIKYPGTNVTFYGMIEDEGSFFLYGITGIETDGGDALLLKVSSEGNILWTNTYKGSDNILIRSGCLNDAGGLTLVGNTMSGVTNDIIVLKTDALGGLVWSKTYGGFDTERGFKIIQISEFNYIVCGSTRSQGSGEEDAVIMRIDPDGELLWVKVIGGSNRDNAFDVSYSSDNTIVFTGAQSSFGSGGYDFGFGKLDLNGNLLFFKTIGSFNQDHSRVIHQVSDDGYVILGHSVSFGSSGLYDILLVKTDINGTVNWSKRYYSPDENYTGDFFEVPDGFVITGSTLLTGDRDLFVLKTDHNGEVQWGKVFDIPDFQEYPFGSKGNCTFDGVDQFMSIGRDRPGMESNGLLLSFTPVAGNHCTEIEFKPSSENLSLHGNDYSGVVGISQGILAQNYPLIKSLVSLETEPLCLLQPVAEFDSDKQAICEGECIHYNDLSINSPRTYSWIFEGGIPETSSAINPSVCYLLSGDYSVSLSVANEAGQDEILMNDYVHVGELPELSLGSDTTLCDSPSVLLTIVGFDSIVWQDGRPGSQYIASLPGNYIAKAYTSDGCFATDSVYISACCNFSLILPNAFTPNGDNFNDDFRPIISDVTNYSMLIANRWGQEIFFTNDSDKAWNGKFNGKTCAEGVYFVVLNFDKCTRSGIPESETVYGAITLIR